MSKSATFSGSRGNYLTLTMSSGIVSQNLTTTKIRIWIDLSSSGPASLSGIRNAGVEIHVGSGSAIEGVDVNIGRDSTKRLLIKEYNISNNADGSGKVDFSAKLPIEVAGYGTASVSDSITWGVQVQPSDFTIPEITLSKEFVIDVQQKSDGVKHNLYVTNTTGTDAIRLGFGDEDPTWKINYDILKKYTTSDKISLSFKLETYYNGNKVGEATKNTLIDIPAEIVPITTTPFVVDTAKNVANVTGGAVLVQLLSAPQIKATASGIWGATIDRIEYRTSKGTVDDQGYIKNLIEAGPISVGYRAKDSRGRWSIWSERTVDVLPYTPPALSFSATRGGDATQVAITRNAVISPLMVKGSQRNKMTLSFKVKENNSSTLQNDNGPGGSWMTVHELINSPANLNNRYDENKSYIVEGTLSDNFTSVTYQARFYGKRYVHAYDKDGRLGVGKHPSQSIPYGSVDAVGGYYVDGVPISEVSSPIKKQTIGLPWGNQCTAVRSGNLVTLSVTGLGKVGVPTRLAKAGETVPVGYRPASSAVLFCTIGNPNDGVKLFILKLEPDGSIYYNSPKFDKTDVWGTVTYLTGDDFPR